MSNLALDENLEFGPAAQAEISALEELRPVPRISIQAFCETASVFKPLERVMADRRMARAHMRVEEGGLLAAAEFFSTNPTPNLVIVETSAEPRKIMDELSRLAEVCDPSSKVVVIGHYNDVTLYRDLIRSGVSEYIVAPVSMADVLSVISGIYVSVDSSPIGRTIAVVGAKGGVGASTISHNLSWAISTLFKNEVVIADMDLAFGTASINFDRDPAQGIAEAVFSPERIDETYLDRLLEQCSEKLSLLAAPSTLDRVYDFEADAFNQIIDTAQRTAPTVVLDVPHVWNGWTKTTLARADEVVIVAAPELANLRNTKNILDTLRKLRPNDKSPYLILNQVGIAKRPEITPADFCSPLGLDPIATIPFDPQFFGNATNNGRMLAETDANHASVKIINEIAHIVTGRHEVKAKSKAGLQSILAKLRKK
ncbi:MAG: AAA family ATPase [Rhizobiaceae bacterium]